MVIIAMSIAAITRDYIMVDELLQTRAQVKHDLLSGGDLADFTAKFPAISSSWLTSFQTDITTAKNFPNDNSVIADVTVLTEDVNASCAEGFVALDRLDTYAKIAFHDSPAKQRVFGQEHWQAARGDQEKTRSVLINAYTEANKTVYKTPLTAAGMNSADIDALNTIAGNIDLKNSLQESALAGRPVTTEERIKVHNVVYEKMQLLKIMSEEVYRGDPAKIAQYLLYPQANSTKSTVIIRITHSGTPVVGCQAKFGNLELAPQVSDALGQVSFESVSFGDSVDVLLSDPTLGNLELDNQTILVGETNIINAVFP